MEDVEAAYEAIAVAQLRRAGMLAEADRAVRGTGIGAGDSAGAGTGTGSGAADVLTVWD